MNRFLRGLASAGLALSLTLSGGVAATAVQPSALPSASGIAAANKAPAAVAIGKIGAKTVTGTRKATIKPVYKKAKGVKVSSAVLSVKRGKKTIARNKKTVALTAGTYQVTTTVKYKFKGKALSVTKSQKLVVKKASVKKSVVKVSGKTTKCPSGYPVKGNRTGSNREWKYHVPGQRYYAKTKPEECFRTAADARKAGYRASKV